MDLEALQEAENEIYQNIHIRLGSVNQILLGKIWFLGDISDVPDSELVEYNDINDFLNIFINNTNKVNLNQLKERVNRLGLGNTLARLIELATSKMH